MTWQPEDSERLSEDAYSQLSEITIARLAQVEAAGGSLPPDIATWSEAEVVRYLEYQRTILEVRIETATEALLRDRISVGQWEEDLGRIISTGLLLALLLLAGGLTQLRQKPVARDLILQSRDQIRSSLRALRRTADRIAAGELSEAQIRDQKRRRSLSFATGFNRARHLDAISSQRHNEGKRFIGSPHPCPDCQIYERRDWTPITEIVPVATFCVCQGRCQCYLITRFNPAIAIQQLQGGSLADQVQRARDFQEKAEQEHLKRHNWG